MGIINALLSAVFIAFGATPISGTIVSTGMTFTPGLARLADGRLMACYATGQHVVNIVAQLSTNAGANWATPAVIQTGIFDVLGLEGCDLTVNSNGTIIMNVNVEAHDLATGQTNVYIGTVVATGTADVLASTTWDGGTNASASVTGTFQNQSYTAPGKVLVLQNGTWLDFIYDASGDVGVLTCTSCNPAAQSWSAQTTVTDPVSGCTSFSEMTAVQQLNGTIYGIIRCDTGTSAGYWSTTSTNNGVTWTAPVSIIPEVTPGKPAFVMNPASGDIILVARSNTMVYYWTYSLGVWSTKTLLSGNQYCYASGEWNQIYAEFDICNGSFTSSDQLLFQQFVIP